MAAIDANVFVTCVNGGLCMVLYLSSGWAKGCVWTQVYTDVIPTGFKIIDETFFYTDTAPRGLKTAN